MSAALVPALAPLRTRELAALAISICASLALIALVPSPVRTSLATVDEA